MIFFEHQTECLRKHSDISKNLDREHKKTITNVYLTKFHKSVKPQWSSGASKYTRYQNLIFFFIKYLLSI